MTNWIIADFVRYLCTVILGVFLGIPLNILLAWKSRKWFRENKCKIPPAAEVTYDSIERQTVDLDTGITFDYFQTKEPSANVARKYFNFELFGQIESLSRVSKKLVQKNLV